MDFAYGFRKMFFYSVIIGKNKKIVSFYESTTKRLKIEGSLIILKFFFI